MLHRQPQTDKAVQRTDKDFLDGSIVGPSEPSRPSLLIASPDKVTRHQCEQKTSFMYIRRLKLDLTLRKHIQQKVSKKLPNICWASLWCLLGI